MKNITAPTFIVDAFCPESVGTEFPESTWMANSPEECLKMLQDCARPEAGIAMVQIWIHQPQVI